MAELAVWLWSVYGLLAVVLPVALQLRRTGSTGLAGVSGSPGSVEWLAGAGLGFHRWRLLSLRRNEQRLQVRIQHAVARIKVLAGLLPICAGCKKKILLASEVAIAPLTDFVHRSLHLV